MPQTQVDQAEALRYYLRVLAPDLLDTAEREYQFNLPRSQHRFDFAWLPQRLAVEVDGGQYAYRGGRHATDGDRDKLNIANALGWRVLRFSPQMLEGDPDYCIAQIRAALGVTA